MKISILNRLVVAAVLSAAWLVGMSMPANAQGQQEQQSQKDEKPQKKDRKQEKEQPQARQKQQQRGQNTQQQQKAQQKQRGQKQTRAVAHNRGNNSKGNNGNHYGRIPDNRYRAHFGHDHSFRMIRPRMVGGYNRFQYSGYSFGFNQPWPVGWSYDDNVYVEYVGGGYYLCNPRYPGVLITLNLF